MVPLRGAARVPQLTVKPRLLQFGMVCVGSSSELPCRLVNESDKLPLRYSITQTGSFHCQPKHGALIRPPTHTLLDPSPLCSDSFLLKVSPHSLCLLSLLQP